MPSIATIGVYGFDGSSFLAALAAADVDLVLDVRQRRGVRGSEYAWANARRLQAALEEVGIGYSHLPELAPTTGLRELQYREDERLGEGKRSRTALAPEYVRLYTEEILDRVNLEPIARSAPASASSTRRWNSRRWASPAAAEARPAASGRASAGGVAAAHWV